MTSTIKRGFGKLGQRTGELLGHGSSSRPDVGDDFKDLQLETDNRHAGTEWTQAALLLYTNQLLKKKEASDNTKLKLYLLENLGSAMLRLGTCLPKDSNYGRALENLGRTEEQLNAHQLKFVNNVKEGWLPELQRSLDDFKEYVALQKQLNARRGDYDSKMVKFQKARKDNITAEDDLRTAQVRYEDTYEDLAQRMMVMQDAEQDYLRGAFSFYEAQLEYHKSCYEELARVRGALDGCLKACRQPAAERLPVAASLATRRSQQALKASEAAAPTRLPIPFSAQPSEPSSGASTPNGGVAAHQAPHPPRAQSDFAASPGGRQGPPTVAPRRHAPPPPAPARGPRRALRQAIYKFHASELGELPLEKGDIVEVVERIDDGWWNGRLVHAATGQSGAKIGQTGLFPGNYTEECSESDVPPSEQAPPAPRVPPAPPAHLRADSYQSPAHQRSGSLQSPGYRPPSSFRTRTMPDAELKLNPAVSKACKDCSCTDHKSNPLDRFRCTNCFHYHS